MTDNKRVEKFMVFMGGPLHGETIYSHPKKVYYHHLRVPNISPDPLGADDSYTTISVKYEFVSVAGGVFKYKFVDEGCLVVSFVSIRCILQCSVFESSIHLQILAL